VQGNSRQSFLGTRDDGDNKKVWANGDNDSIRDGTLRGEDKWDEGGVVGGGKGEDRKQARTGARDRQQKQENVLQTHEVVKELRAS
jgi:hypothetical protein